MHHVSFLLLFLFYLFYLAAGTGKRATTVREFVNRFCVTRYQQVCVATLYAGQAAFIICPGRCLFWPIHVHTLVISRRSFSTPLNYSAQGPVCLTREQNGGTRKVTLPRPLHSGYNMHSSQLPAWVQCVSHRLASFVVGDSSIWQIPVKLSLGQARCFSRLGFFFCLNGFGAMGDLSWSMTHIFVCTCCDIEFPKGNESRHPGRVWYECQACLPGWSPLSSWAILGKLGHTTVLV